MGRDSLTHLKSSNGLSSPRRVGTSSDSSGASYIRESDEDLEMRAMSQDDAAEKPHPKGHGSVTIRSLPDDEDLAMRKQAEQRNVWI